MPHSITKAKAKPKRAAPIQDEQTVFSWRQIPISPRMVEKWADELDEWVLKKQER